MEDDPTAERPPLSKWALSVHDEEAAPTAPPPSPRTAPDSSDSSGASRLPLLSSVWVVPPDTRPETLRPSAPSWVLEPAVPVAAVEGSPALKETKPSFTCVVCLLLNVLVWAMALAVLFVFVEKSDSVRLGYAAIGVYSLYVAAYLFSGSGRALCNMGQASDATAYITFLRSAPVRITAWISCYHYETYTRSVTARKGRRTRCMTCPGTRQCLSTSP